jgi:hypothetical protein
MHLARALQHQITRHSTAAAALPRWGPACAALLQRRHAWWRSVAQRLQRALRCQHGELLKCDRFVDFLRRTQ